VPEDHVEALRQMYAAQAEGDFTAGADLLHPDFELDTIEDVTEPEPIRGRERVAEWMREYLSTFSELRIRAESIEPAGDRVLVSAHNTGVQRVSGYRLDLRYFSVWRFRDGLAVESRNQTDVRAARRLAGLPDGDLDIVRSVYEAWERGEPWAVLHVVEPDVAWFDGIPLERATYRGIDGVKRQVRGYLEPWDDFRVVLEEVREAGSRVLGLVRIAGRGKTSGLETDVPLGHLWRMRDGRATEVRLLPRDEALAEADD
jgi:uncharacterized protein